MLNDDRLGELLDEADNRGTIDYDREETVNQFIDDLTDLLGDRDTIPNGRDLTEAERFDWMDFFDEYELWDDVRDEWEDYEKAA